MNLFSKLWSAFGWGGLANKDSGPQYSGPQNKSTEAGVVVSDERAMQVTAVWSCVRLISESVGALPLNVYQRTETGREPADDHYLYDLLRVSPNAAMTGQEFREALTLQLALFGNGYARISWSGKRPIALMPLQPERMTPVLANGGITYHYATDEGIQVYAKKSILHLKGFSGGGGVVGLSPLAYARAALGVTVAADKHASKAFNSGGRPPGVIMVDRFLTPEQREDLKSVYTGITLDDSQTWVLEGGMKYESVGIPPDDLQMIESRRFQLGEIARVFRVPSHLINDTEKSTSWGSGIEQMNLAFLQYTLQPYLTRWETVLGDALLSREDRRRYFVKHNVESLLRADSQARASFLSTMCQNGIMTRNEARSKEDLPAVPGGDDLTVQVNLTPVDQLEKVGNATEI